MPADPNHYALAMNHHPSPCALAVCGACSHPLLQKVRATMRGIKVVLGERQRATEAAAVDKARLQRIERLTDPAAVEKEAAARKVAAAVASAKPVMVTYKKFGRKFVVPEEEAPESPTRQQRKVAAKRVNYFVNLGKRSALVLEAQRKAMAGGAGSAAVAAAAASAPAQSAAAAAPLA